MVPFFMRWFYLTIALPARLRGRRLRTGAGRGALRGISGCAVSRVGRGEGPLSLVRERQPPPAVLSPGVRARGAESGRDADGVPRLIPRGQQGDGVLRCRLSSQRDRSGEDRLHQSLRPEIPPAATTTSTWTKPIFDSARSTSRSSPCREPTSTRCSERPRSSSASSSGDSRAMVWSRPPSIDSTISSCRSAEAWKEPLFPSSGQQRQPHVLPQSQRARWRQRRRAAPRPDITLDTGFPIFYHAEVEDWPSTTTSKAGSAEAFAGPPRISGGESTSSASTTRRRFRTRRSSTARSTRATWISSTAPE